jgi:hypothetical protein
MLLSFWEFNRSLFCEANNTLVVQAIVWIGDRWAGRSLGKLGKGCAPDSLWMNDTAGEFNQER